MKRQNIRRKKRCAKRKKYRDILLHSAPKEFGRIHGPFDPESQDAECCQVVGAKIVTNARSPGAKFFGCVTMASVEEADNCIENLNQTLLHGKHITVEKVWLVSAWCGYL